MELIDVFKKYINPVVHESSKVNTEICKECGGQCCKSMGCHISPLDLKEITFESIVNFIDESGYISIDWWDGNPITKEATGEKVFFLRIKNRNAKVIDPAFRGVCSILTDSGCPLSFEYRPKGARELIPCKKKCVGNYSKQDCAAEWYSYNDILKEVYMHYFMKNEVTQSPFMLLAIMNDFLKETTGKGLSEYGL